MNKSKSAQNGSGALNLSPTDILLILFRHKKKIVFFWLLGAIVGIGIYKLWPVRYQSNAQILVRYVAENRQVVDEDGGTRFREAGGRGGDHIIRAERAILTSLDMAKSASEKLKTTHPDLSEAEFNRIYSPGMIKGKLNTSSARGSNLFHVSYLGANREATQEILEMVIETYLQKHKEIHGASSSFDDFLTEYTDKLKARLSQTETELLKERQKVGAISIASAKGNLSTNIGAIKSSILTTQTELAEQKSIMEQLNSTVKREPIAENQSPETSAIDEEFLTAVAELERLRIHLNFLHSRQQELATRFTRENPLLRSTYSQIQETERVIASIKRDNPALATTMALTPDPTSPSTIVQSNGRNTIQSQAIKVRSLETRLTVLQSQLAELRDESAKIDQAELVINELARRKSLEESEYRTALASLEKSRLDAALSTDRANNIGIVQSPSPAYVATSGKTKAAAAALGGIAAIGLAWAFLVDMLLDRTLKHSKHIERSLGIPLFLTIPKIIHKGLKITGKPPKDQGLLLAAANKSLYGKDQNGPRSTTLKAAQKAQPENYGATDSEAPVPTAWEEEPVLLPYYEALRDRVIGFFESRGLAHKPKLIGLTGLGDKPGVTTISYGLASCLSKTGEGNVLLVDMTLGHESAQQFYNGKQILGIDEALNERENAQLNDNLYIAAEGSNGYKVPKILPNRFNALVPKLKSSDFDYIIFDMPEVSQISVTPRLARFMDAMLMVVESEKANEDVAKKAVELLENNNNNIGAILNKAKRYLPKKLEQDFMVAS